MCKYAGFTVPSPLESLMSWWNPRADSWLREKLNSPLVSLPSLLYWTKQTPGTITQHIYIRALSRLSNIVGYRGNLQK